VRWLITLEDVTEIREMQRLKQEFTAIISHELRTPLTSVKAFLSGFSLGVYGEMKEGLLKRVGGIQSSVERLIRLINDLLDSEKMAAGMLTINLRPLEFDEVITDAMHSVREIAEKQKVNIATEPCRTQVNGDHDRLVQVMINLLSNAIKHSPAGGDIKVSIRQEGEYMQVAVSDQGSGIAKESQALIFERFHQVDSDLSKRRGGTGLGLYLSKYLVEKHGGTIGVTSELGKGSTFWFRLPVM
jgi:signal transduction histidine kinase